MFRWLSLSTSSSREEVEDLSDGVETCFNSESVDDPTDESNETFEMLESESDEDEDDEALAFLLL